MSESAEKNRRPIASRGNAHIVRLAAALARKPHPTPNEISLLSAVFACAGAALLAWAAHSPWALLLCALCVQLRLLCNLIDGMVAVEGGKKTATGEIYNEFPDRVADSVLIVALGHAVGHDWIGWLGALLAMATAYIRVFGGSLGFAQSFRGPFAKQQRMATLTLACVLGAIETWLGTTQYALWLGLLIITAGSAITCITRTRAIATQMRERAQG